MTHDILNILKEQKKMKLKGNIYHVVQTKFSYNTNRIEGSTLTEEQTIQIFETNTITNEGTFTKIDDIIETTNHFKLFNYMLDTIDKPLDEELIKEYHRILKSGTSDDRDKDWFVVGGYKTLANVVGGMETTKPANVEKEIGKLLNDYHAKKNKTLVDIIDFHVAFEKIHPFQDGNGRVGRMIMFRETLINKVTPFIIDEKHKDFYYRGLKQYRLNEKGWLLDTIGSSQDEFAKLCDMLLEGHN